MKVFTNCNSYTGWSNKQYCKPLLNYQ